MHFELDVNLSFLLTTLTSLRHKNVYKCLKVIRLKANHVL